MRLAAILVAPGTAIALAATEARPTTAQATGSALGELDEPAERVSKPHLRDVPRVHLEQAR
jgi:hypothetical protein